MGFLGNALGSVSYPFKKTLDLPNDKFVRPELDDFAGLNLRPDIRYGVGGARSSIYQAFNK